MALVYNFSFASPAAGETVTVTDDSGTEYASEALGTTIGDDGAITLQVALDEGEYTGTVSGSFGTWFTRGELDVPTSITSQPGASETAYLIAPATAVPDTNATEVAGTLAFRDGTAEVSWLTLENGGFTLSEDAGGVFISLRVKGEADFSGTSTPPDGETVGMYCTMSRNGSSAGTPSPISEATADGVSDVITIPAGDAQGYFVLGGAFTIVVACYAATVTDGTATVDTIVNITRVAPAPVFDA